MSSVTYYLREVARCTVCLVKIGIIRTYVCYYVHKIKLMQAKNHMIHVSLRLSNLSRSYVCEFFSLYIFVLFVCWSNLFVKGHNFHRWNFDNVKILLLTLWSILHIFTVLLRNAICKAWIIYFVTFLKTLIYPEFSSDIYLQIHVNKRSQFGRLRSWWLGISYFC